MQSFFVISQSLVTHTFLRAPENPNWKSFFYPLGETSEIEFFSNSTNIEKLFRGLEFNGDKKNPRGRNHLFKIMVINKQPRKQKLT